MHCLEVICFRNLQVAANGSQHTPPQYGWAVTHDGYGHITVVGHEHRVVIDCSNPLDDAELVTFHRQYRDSMPKWVRFQVESLASEYRRYTIVACGVRASACK